MSTFAQRLLVLLAALMLAAASVGCDREAGDNEMGVGEEGVIGEEEGVALGEPGVEDDELEPQAAQEELAEGLVGEEGLEETRDDVADELGIPSEALTFGPQVRESIMKAKSDFERKAWGTVGAVEQQMTRVNMDDFDEAEQAAATELQQQLASAQQNLQRMEEASEQDARQMQSQIEDDLEEMRKNWNEIVDKLEVGRSPAGGGPIEDDERLFDDREHSY